MNKRKYHHILAGWNTEFCDVPRNVKCNVIIKGGQFETNKLVKTNPFCKIADSRKNISNHKLYYDIPFNIETGEGIYMKNGIRDPFLDYLVFKGLKNYTNNDIMDFNLDTTEQMLTRFGIVFTQGIPDPWKTWPNKKKIEEKHIEIHLKNSAIVKLPNEKIPSRNLIKNKSKFETEKVLEKCKKKEWKIINNNGKELFEANKKITRRETGVLANERDFSSLNKKKLKENKYKPIKYCSAMNLNTFKNVEVRKFNSN